MKIMKYGRYKVVNELGRGTMGVVYKAHDPQIDRMVALKVLRPDRVVSQDFVLRFLREAKAIGRISHPNIVTVYDVGQDHGTIYIAMEYLEGRPLNEVIKDRTVPVDETVGMCVQVAEALEYAHRQGIIHRDIKPSNIILTPDNRIKLTDFGIARIEDPDAAQQTQAGDILGTPVYMAPEQVMGQKADGRTDLYALGVIAYEMVVGKRPFGGGNIAAIFRSITHEPPENPMTMGSLDNRALADLILKSLSKDPANRFQTGEAMATALKRCLDTSTHPFPPVLGDISFLGMFVGVWKICGGIWQKYNFTTNGPTKKGDPFNLTKESPLKRKNEALDHGHVRSGRSFGSLLDVKGNTVTFAERFESGGVDSRMMDEYIRPIFLLDKTKTLAVIKPLHNTVCH